MFRPLAWTKTLAVGFSSLLAITLVPVLMLVFIRGKLRPEARNPLSRITQAIYLPILRLCLRFRKTTLLLNLIFLVFTLPTRLQDRQPVHAALVRGLLALHADRAARHFHHPGLAAHAGAGPRDPLVSRGRERFRHCRPLRERDRQRTARYVRHDRHAEAARAMAGGHDLRKAHPGNGRQAPVSGAVQHLDHARRKPPRHGADGHQDARSA